MPRITDVQTFITCPRNLNLVVVKVETDSPGLVGYGCATFTWRCVAVKAYADEHLKALVVGRDADRIEDLHRLMSQNGYWRNGPVGNNAVSGVDMALWDLKAKQAGMALYDLWGGKYREAALVYRHTPSGGTLEELLEKVDRHVAQGIRVVRIQGGGTFSKTGKAEGAGYGGPADPRERPAGALDGAYYDGPAHCRNVLKAIAAVRQRYEDLEIIHDVHGKLRPAEAVAFAKELEPLGLYFLEDPLPPEQLAWLGNIRQTCTTPIGLGELFVHPNEWKPLISERMIDFMRMHLSAIGGLTPARKAAVLGEAFGVRTAWHGPGDVSPIGHAAQLHLDVASPEFGVQEYGGFADPLPEIFPGLPELRNGYLYPTEQPGHGVGFNEAEAAKYPYQPSVAQWSQARNPDGGLYWP